MKLLLVSNFASDKQYSMLGFADCLERELPSRGVNVTRISPVAKLSGISKKPTVQKWLAYLDKFVIFPKRLRASKKSHDLIHILDHGNAMYIPHVSNCRHLITCHDLLAMRAAEGEIPGWDVGPSGRKYQALIKSGLKRADFVVSVSNATNRDVKRLIGLPEGKQRLIYNGHYQPLPVISTDRLTQLRDQLSLPEKFLLHVGSDSPYKNRLGLIEIYRQLRVLMPGDAPALVLAGRPLQPDFQAQLDREMPGCVRTVDSPDSRTLSGLYQLAAALVFPSTHEGFGLPILEAQTLGCPVFTTDRQPMTEVGGDAARYFDPADPAKAAQVIAENLGCTDEMREEGICQVGNFSTDRMVDQYVQLYRDLRG